MGDVLDEEMMINADRYLPVDDTLIPTGEPAAVKGTPMDFTRPTTIGSRIDQVGSGGYDHCYVLNREQKARAVDLAAQVVEPTSGRAMEVYTTQPASSSIRGTSLTARLPPAA